MNRNFLISSLICVCLLGCYSSPKLLPEYEEDNRILNSTEYSEDTKRELLRARYLNRMDKLETSHDPAEYRPVVDKKVCADCPYDKDLASCSNLARENSSKLGGTIGGAAIGAATGALLGAATGLDAGILVGGGAASGAVGGLGKEVIGYRQMIAQCMRGRGYSVLR